MELYLSILALITIEQANVAYLYQCSITAEYRQINKTRNDVHYIM